MQKTSLLYFVLASVFMIGIALAIWLGITRGGRETFFQPITQAYTVSATAQAPLQGIMAQHVERVRPQFADATHLNALQTAIGALDWAGAATHVDALKTASEALPDTNGSDVARMHLGMLAAEVGILRMLTPVAGSAPPVSFVLSTAVHDTFVKRFTDRLRNLATAMKAIPVDTQARWQADMLPASKNVCSDIPADCTTLWTEFSVARNNVDDMGTLTVLLSTNPPNYARAVQTAVFTRHVLEAVANGTGRSALLALAYSLEAEMGTMALLMSTN